MPWPTATGSDHDSFDAEKIERDTRADHVDDGVDPTHLVEMNFGWVHLVDRPFRFGEHGENPLGVVTHPLGQVGRIDDGCDVGRCSMRVPFIGLDGEVRGGDAVSLNRLRAKRPVVDAEPIEAFTNLVDVGTSIDKGAEHHVARNPVERVDPQCLHEASNVSIRMAETAAP